MCSQFMNFLQHKKEHFTICFCFKCHQACETDNVSITDYIQDHKITNATGDGLRKFVVYTKLNISDIDDVQICTLKITECKIHNSYTQMY